MCPGAPEGNGFSSFSGNFGGNIEGGEPAERGVLSRDTGKGDLTGPSGPLTTSDNCSDCLAEKSSIKKTNELL